MTGISPSDLMTFVTVALAIFAAIVTVDKVIDIFKKWRSPSADTAKKLAVDKARLDEHEESIHELKEENRVVCAALLALLDHELHNGNADQMERARDDLMKYLQGLITKRR